MSLEEYVGEGEGEGGDVLCEEKGEGILELGYGDKLFEREDMVELKKVRMG